MRLWSLHPCYLDRQGLLALWREGLLAKAVLAGTTSGYRRHPQLVRFRSHQDPMLAINNYLHAVQGEAAARGYRFDAAKLDPMDLQAVAIPVSLGQLHYEQNHLLKKLSLRDPDRVVALEEWPVRVHPLFCAVPGDIEPWEKVATIQGDGGGKA